MMSTSDVRPTCSYQDIDYNMDHSPGHYDLTDLFSSTFDDQAGSSFEFSDLFDDLSDDSLHTCDDNASRGISHAFSINNNTENTDFYDAQLYEKETERRHSDVNGDSPDILRILKQMSSDVQSPTSNEYGPVSMCVDNVVQIYDENYNIQPRKLSRNTATDENRPKCKRIRKRKSQRKSVRLFEFLWHYLNTEPNDCVAWVDKTAGIFRLVDNKLVAELWGKYKNNEKMTYESLSRGLRHYYRRGIFERMSQKLHYRFVPKAIELCKQSRLLL